MARKILGYDLSAMPADVVALAWLDDHGHIEYDNSNCKTPWDDHKSNDQLTELPVWADQIANQPRPMLMAVVQTEAEQQAMRDAVLAAGRAKQEEREAAMMEKIYQRMKAES